MASNRPLSPSANGNNSTSVSPQDTCCGGHDGSHASHTRMPTIFDIVKSGMLVPFQTIVEEGGQEVLKARDEKGHTPAHWACLGGHSTILRYMIEMKAPIDEPSENELRQHPVHWACVNGHIGIVDILLQVGVNIDTVDAKGCTPLIVSCQYGKTMLCGYLMGKGSRLQAVDKDGDMALHWAAFKGHSELMRLLIYSGFNAHQRDNFGQTPLHLACINGNITSVKELCEQDGVELALADKNGKTPLMLAMGRKHENVVTYLKKTAKKKTSYFSKIDIWSLVFGPPGNSKGPLIFFVFNMLFWAYPMYLIKCLPMTWVDLEPLHIIFMLLNAVMWVSLYHASTTDPGFLPRNIPEYDRAIKEVAHYDEWKHGRNPLSRLCHTCRTVKPMRSKHCRICNRCVRQFDHHCPYIYNCVGIKNRVWFFLFTALTFTNCLIAAYFAHEMIRVGGSDWLMIFSIFMLLLGIAVSGMVATCASDFHHFYGGIHGHWPHDSEVHRGSMGDRGEPLVLLLRFCYRRLLFGSLPISVIQCLTFISFPMTFFINGAITLYFTALSLELEGIQWYHIVGIPEGIFFIIISGAIVGFTVYHAAVNLTTNERINYRRYDYLKDGKGKYYNPYNRGWKNNMLEFFHLKSSIDEDSAQFMNAAVV